MTQNRSIASIENICQACGVLIDSQDRVHFNYGPTGDRKRLFARVCQFSQSTACLNQGCNVESITPTHCYGTGQVNQEAYRHLQEQIRRRVA